LNIKLQRKIKASEKKLREIEREPLRKIKASVKRIKRD